MHGQCGRDRAQPLAHIGRQAEAGRDLHQGEPQTIPAKRGDRGAREDRAADEATDGLPERRRPALNQPSHTTWAKGMPRQICLQPMAAVPTAAPGNSAPKALKESVLAAELTIEGKIEGAGHVRIAGRFKGDVHVQGNVTIDQGAVVTGEVKADVVIIAGQLDGNVEAVTRVELVSTGLLNGDLKAGSLTVAAGSRMRGRAEFGWNDKKLG